MKPKKSYQPINNPPSDKATSKECQHKRLTSIIKMMFGPIVKKGKHKTSPFTGLTKPQRNKTPQDNSTILIHLVDALWYKDFHDWNNTASNSNVKKHIFIWSNEKS